MAKNSLCNSIFSGAGEPYLPDKTSGWLADYPLGSVYVNFYDSQHGDNDICSSANYNKGYLPNYGGADRPPACVDPNLQGMYLCIRFWKSDSFSPFDVDAWAEYSKRWYDDSKGFAQWSYPLHVGDGTGVCETGRGVLVPTSEFFWIPGDGNNQKYGSENAWVSQVGFGLFSDDSCNK